MILSTQSLFSLYFLVVVLAFLVYAKNPQRDSGD